MKTILAAALLLALSACSASIDKVACRDDSHCATGSYCGAAGRCLAAPACAAGTSLCRDHCADTQGDPANCGAGCATCAPPASNGQAVCNAGVCGVSCAAGFHQVGGGCLSNSTVSSCGPSGTACPTPPHATAACDGAACGYTCDAHFAHCGGPASGGCETSLATDPANCGTCAHACAGPASNGHAACAASQCAIACDAGFHLAAGACIADTTVTSCGPAGVNCAQLPNSTPTCDGTRCGVACSSGYSHCSANAADGCEVNTAADVGHCGSCTSTCSAPSGATATCNAGLCGYDSNAAITHRWSSATTGDTPWLAMWPDGTIRAGQVNTPVDQIDPATGVVKQMANGNGRTSIMVRTGAPSYALAVFSGIAAFDEQDNQVFPDSTSYGCCNYGGVPIPLDPVHQLMYVFKNSSLVRIDGNTGRIVGSGPSTNAFPGYLSLDDTLAFSAGTGGVQASTLDLLRQAWSVSLGSGQWNGLAIAPDGSVVGTSTSDNLVARFGRDGTIRWQHAAPAPGWPTITPNGLAVFSTAPTASTYALDAYNLSDGALQWRTAVTGQVGDVLVGDAGIVYASIQSSTAGGNASIFGLDQDKGTIRYRFTGLGGGGSNELMLRNGVMYIRDGANVTALNVPSQSYPSGSSWPVKFHDNQRTCNATSTLNY